MAAADKITVAVERAVHDALRESIQNIADQHGIMVDAVHVSWVHTDRLGGVGRELKHFVQEITAETRSVHA